MTDPTPFINSRGIRFADPGPAYAGRRFDPRIERPAADDATPYGRKGSGHAGSETSRARQEREDSTGITGKRQTAVYEVVVTERRDGMTCAEVEGHFRIGHGAASAALTKLHKAGHVARLLEPRSGQQPYVIPSWIEGRPTSPYRPNKGGTIEDTPSGTVMYLIAVRRPGRAKWEIGLPQLYASRDVATGVMNARSAKLADNEYRVASLTIPEVTP